MLGFWLYVIFEFIDNIFSSLLLYIYFPENGYSLFDASSYAYILTISNVLGFILLFLGYYRFGFLNYSLYVITLSLLSLLIGLSPSNFTLPLLFLFFVFHIAFFFWYESLAIKFEKFEALIGFSYSAGFLALGVLLFFEKLNLRILSFLYAFSLLSMLYFKNVKLPKRSLKLLNLKDLKFIREMLVIWFMGEYAEVLVSMAYYVLKDTTHFSDVQIYKLFAIALFSAFFSALLSPLLLRFMKVKCFGRLALLLMISIPFLLSLPSLLYVLAVLVGASVAFYWVYFRTYLYYTYPLEEYIERFMFFYFSSHIGGVILYAFLFQLFHNHQISLMFFSAILFILLVLDLL